MTLDGTSLAIGLVCGIVLMAVLNFRVVRRLALTLHKLGVELGIEGGEDAGVGGVKMGDVHGDVSGEIAGRDIVKKSNFLKNVMAAASESRKSGPVLIIHEHVKIDFSEARNGAEAAQIVQRLGSQMAFFPTKANQQLLLPHIERFERDGWKVAAIQFSDTGTNGYYATFNLERPVETVV